MPIRILYLVASLSLLGLAPLFGQETPQVADTRFNIDRGFYTEPFFLEISSATEGATIRFTTDGSAPTDAMGETYETPIRIGTTTVVRAMAFKEGLTSTNVDTHTYLFLEDVIRQQTNVPGYARNTYDLGGGEQARHDYEMDPEIVNHKDYRDEIIPALRSLPTMALSVDPSEIFGSSGFYDGTSREKAVSVEILYPNEPTKNEQGDGGIESHSHNRLKRSLRLNFREEEYGDAKFRTRLLRDHSLDGQSATRSFDRLILRAGNNRSWARAWSFEKTTYALDEFARQTQAALSGIAVRGTFVHLYINGLYWGLYNPVERADKWFASDYFGGEPDDYFVVHHGGDLSGNDDRYDYLKGTLKNKNMAQTSNYAELLEHLHIDSFIDYILLHWYLSVGDWPPKQLVCVSSK